MLAPAIVGGGRADVHRVRPPRALIRRASPLCAALLFAAVLSRKPVYPHVQNLGVPARLPADRRPPLPPVCLRTPPADRHLPRHHRAPPAPPRRAPRWRAPRALRRLRRRRRTPLPRAGTRAFRTARPGEPAVRQRARPARTAVRPGRTEPRRGCRGPDRASGPAVPPGLAVPVRSAPAPGARRLVGAGTDGDQPPARHAARLPLRAGRLTRRPAPAGAARRPGRAPNPPRPGAARRHPGAPDGAGRVPRGRRPRRRAPQPPPGGVRRPPLARERLGCPAPPGAPGRPGAVRARGGVAARGYDRGTCDPGRWRCRS